MFSRLAEAIVEMREQAAIALDRQLLSDGADPLSLLDDCRDAMQIVGKRFEAVD